MNYRHAYHAGNFADVIKHITLTALISSFMRKDTPICYLDTHAGIGYYDLFADFASKTKEYENGIEKIIGKDNPPPIVKQYLHSVHSINNKLTGAKYASLRYYPGSPMIVRQLIRPKDRIIACELQPQDYQTLKNTFAGDHQIAVHHMDGFLGLKAFLPPKENRGLVLIDPPYESPDEFNRVAQSLPISLKRWETGVYAIWFPIKERVQIERLYRNVKQLIDRPVLAIELTIYPDLPNHLNGCGMIIVNPPWQFDDSIAKILPWCWEALSVNKQGGYRTLKLK